MSEAEINKMTAEDIVEMYADAVAEAKKEIDRQREEIERLKKALPIRKNNFDAVINAVVSAIENIKEAEA